MQRILFILTLAASLASTAFAQGAARGTVSGKVTNATGVPVAQAAVTVTSDVAPSYKGKATTNATGDFSVADVPAGPVTASAVQPNGVVRASAKGTISNASPSVVLTIQIPAGK
jgi:hypothetical protein